mmetsp:Transcript_14934/g.18464  ORF Transcript_14934/g.18464 Transcript_14934/m.18464 type:complete len:516 (+) Transcript_14934:153-1700(+)
MYSSQPFSYSNKEDDISSDDGGDNDEDEDFGWSLRRESDIRSEPSGSRKLKTSPLRVDKSAYSYPEVRNTKQEHESQLNLGNINQSNKISSHLTSTVVNLDNRLIGDRECNAHGDNDTDDVVLFDCNNPTLVNESTSVAEKTLNEDEVDEAAVEEVKETVGNQSHSNSNNMNNNDHNESDDLPEVPKVLVLPREVWALWVDEATSCWEECNQINTDVDPVTIFKRLGDSFRIVPLGPKADIDVVFSQLMKDIKRETIIINNERFIAATRFDELYQKLANIIESQDEELAGTRALDHRVQRILRACSRTVFGYDSYEVVSSLISPTVNPKALVTPGMMDQSPITIETSDTCITINAENVFKVNRELNDGSVATILALRVTVTETITFKSWESTRWLSMKPCDKVEDSLGAFVKFRDDFLDQLAQECGKDQKLTLEFIASAREALGKALNVTTAAVKRMTHEEFLRGKQAAFSNGSSANSRSYDNSRPATVRTDSDNADIKETEESPRWSFLKMNSF